MNMILKKQMVRRRGRAGFTLVEVIVVLVILAILAAIAIPALTGYIDKAEEKKYISQARNAIVALRAVLSEDYADGKFSGNLTTSQAAFLKDGASGYPSTNLKCYSEFDFNKYFYTDVSLTKKASELMASELPEKGSLPGYWDYVLIAPKNPDAYTIFDAPAFRYQYYPEGAGTNVAHPVIIVTYGIDLADMKFDTHSEFKTALLDNGTTYDASAGYKVYKAATVK